MKIKALIFAVILLCVGYGAYLWGWYQGVAYNAVASAIAHGDIDLLTAQALRKNNVQGALQWAETDLYNQGITLEAFKNHPPKVFEESLKKVSSRIDLYKSENKAGLQHPITQN